MWLIKYTLKESYMLSVTDIAAQLESIHRSIALDKQTIEIYKQAAGSDLTSPLSITFLHMVATVQGTIATKQLQASLLQMHLRLI